MNISLFIKIEFVERRAGMGSEPIAFATIFHCYNCELLWQFVDLKII